MKTARNPIAKDSVRGLPGMLDEACWHGRWRKVAQALTQDMAQGVKVVLFTVSCVCLWFAVECFLSFASVVVGLPRWPLP